ncbi:MAG: class I SAM-dependent methyltransferase [Bacteroidota bacterium]|nr:class I SAM-dependent methyltransferase [Bacteroidota bacterium]
MKNSSIIMTQSTIPDVQLKNSVREFWNSHPCGTQFTNLEWGSKAFFDEVERFRYATQPFMNTIVGFNRFRGKNVIEIGCGLGTDLMQFARNGAHVTGIDLTPQSIALVKRRFALEGLPVRAMVADAENLPFEDNTFDLVYSFGVLHHTPDTQKAIDEVYRILKPGGNVIIMLYNKTSLHVWLGVPLYVLLRLQKNNSNGKKGGGIVRDWIRVYDGTENPLGKAYSKTEMERMFSKFKNRQYTICDSYRRHLPKLANTVNQKLFASWCGFWRFIKAEK